MEHNADGTRVRVFKVDDRVRTIEYQPRRGDVIFVRGMEVGVRFHDDLGTISSQHPDNLVLKRRVDIDYTEELKSRIEGLPKGDWNWPGAKNDRYQLQVGLGRVGNHHPFSFRSELELQTMAVLACGHEETCKAHMYKLMSRGFICRGWLNARIKRKEKRRIRKESKRKEEDTRE